MKTKTITKDPEVERNINRITLELEKMLSCNKNNLMLYELILIEHAEKNLSDVLKSIHDRDEITEKLA